MIQQKWIPALHFGLLTALVAVACSSADRLGMVAKDSWPRVMEIPYAENGDYESLATGVAELLVALVK